MNRPASYVEPNRRNGPPAQAPSCTQVTMPTVFKISKPITELNIITISALKRALERHLRMPGNQNLVVHLYAIEYFSYPLLDKIETNLNSYYGSTIAEVLETEEWQRKAAESGARSVEEHTICESGLQWDGGRAEEGLYREEIRSERENLTKMSFL